jgi:hypothetical protein
MSSAVAEAIDFRDRYHQIAPGASFSTLEAALYAAPPLGATPLEEMTWVADNLDYVGEGLQAARLPDGFNTVYAGLSRTIANNMSDYSTPDVAHTAIIFEGHYRRPLANALQFLDGDNSALETISMPWQISLLRPTLLDQDLPPGVQAGLGINTHIRARDLGQSLVTSNPSDDYYYDYTATVGTHINETIDTLSGVLMPGHPSLRKVSVLAMKRLIAVGREHAWQDYEQARNMPVADQEETWKACDRRAARFGRMYLAVGGPVITMAHATERFKIGNREDNGFDDDLAA